MLKNAREDGSEWVVTGGGEVPVEPSRAEARAMERRVAAVLARNGLARTVRCVVRQVSKEVVLMGDVLKGSPNHEGEAGEGAS